MKGHAPFQGEIIKNYIELSAIYDFDYIHVIQAWRVI